MKTVTLKERQGSGCGSVGRAVAFDTRGPRFESSHWQKFINIEHLYTVNCVLKRRNKNKEKEAVNGPFFKKTLKERQGSGCGSVGKAVASDPRDPRFKYGHRHEFKPR